MSRLKRKYHVQFEDYPGYRKAWKNTNPATITLWDTVARRLSNSTYATLWSFWKIWTYQLNDPKITNYLYIEWLWRDIIFPWPYGTMIIPTGELGKSKCGWVVMGLTIENAIK